MQITTLCTRRLVLAVATCALASGTAYVQNITLYGLIDTDIEHVSHANTNGNDLTRIPSVTGTLPSRRGLCGTEDLGNGMKAMFTLESGFNTDTGISGQGGRLFGRQAWVGLASDYGTVTLGRQYSMVFLFLAGADILGPSQYAIGSLDVYILNMRVDNTITYKGILNGLIVGATHSFGRDMAGGVSASGTCVGEVAGNALLCRMVSAVLKYDAATFGVADAYEEQCGGAGATASFFNGSVSIAFTDTGDKDRHTVANGYVKLGNARLGVGWIGRHVQAVAGDVRSNLYFVSGSYPPEGALTLDAGLIRLVNADRSHSATTTVLHGVCTLSKRTTLYAQTGYLWNSANAQYSVSGDDDGITPARGVNQPSAMVGMRTAFR